MSKCPVLCAWCQHQTKLTASNSLCWLAWKADMKWESICFNNWQKVSCGQHWNPSTLQGTAFERTEGQSACHSTTCRFSRSLQSSRSLQLKARKVEWPKCAQLPLSQLNSWAGVESTYIIGSYLGKWIMPFPSDRREGCNFPLFLQGERGVRHCARAWQTTTATCEHLSFYKRSSTDVGEDGNNGVVCRHTEIPRVPVCSTEQHWEEVDVNPASDVILSK